MGDRERARLRARVALLAGLSPLLCADPARADVVDAGGAGVFFGYALDEGGGFEWGIEVFATHFLNPRGACAPDSEPRVGVGPLLRLSPLSSHGAQVTLTAHGGTELETTSGSESVHSLAALDAEVGARFFLPDRGASRVALHTGVLLEAAFFNAYLRQAWLMEAQKLAPVVSLGGGVRYAPTFGLPSGCDRSVAVPGRPCRDHAGRRQRVSVHVCARFDPRAPRALVWAERAAEECASVPAFLQLALELLDLEAPIALVERALAAADEELGHTRAALQLASHFGGGAVRLLPPRFRPRPLLPRRRALARLARESWLDGCVNEGLAAEIAASEAASSAHPAEADVSRRIAREERGHAGLAADVLRWATTSV